MVLYDIYEYSTTLNNDGYYFNATYELEIDYNGDGYYYEKEI